MKDLTLKAQEIQKAIKALQRINIKSPKEEIDKSIKKLSQFQ